MRKRLVRVLRGGGVLQRPGSRSRPEPPLGEGLPNEMVLVLAVIVLAVLVSTWGLGGSISATPGRRPETLNKNRRSPGLW